MARKIIIRLQRNRTYKKPQYKIVAVFKDTKTRSAPLDILGLYNPMAPHKTFFINIERLAFWAYKGAEVSNRVVKLVGIFFSSVFYTKKFARKNNRIVLKNKTVKSKNLEQKPRRLYRSDEEFIPFIKNKSDYNNHIQFSKVFWAKKNSNLINDSKSTFSK